MQKEWWEETVRALVVMHDWEQQKQLEEAIRELVRLAVRRAELEGYARGYEDGKRRAVNCDVASTPGLTPNGGSPPEASGVLAFNPTLCFGGTRCGQ